MVDPKKYHLQVTTGTSYDSSTHKLVHVNTATPVELHSDRLDGHVDVKIQNYRGLPSDSPSTSDYFSKPPHTSDLYSISFDFKLKQSIPANELLFGNDFEHPIRDKLPPGFSAALRLVKWSIDPGLDGDVYADRPYLYGPLASSINQLWVGDKNDATIKPGDEVLHEGGSEEGQRIRDEKKLPKEGPARMKHFLTEAHKKDWTFEAGREYKCDFYNPYLDFNDLALKLPGNFKLHLMSFWDGQPLRYVMKHRTADGSKDEVLFVVIFTLVPEEEVEQKAKQLEQEQKRGPSTGRDASGMAGGGGGGGPGPGDSTNADDVD